MSNTMRPSTYRFMAQTLAQALNECRTEPISGVVLTIKQFADNLYIDNANFSKQQFIDNIALYTVNERAGRALATLKTSYELVEVTEF